MQQQMQKHNKKKKTLNIASIVIVLMVWLCTIVFSSFSSFSMASETDDNANTITPTENQYLEMRATEIKEVEGKNRQVTFELWGYDVEFKGVDVRFSYQSSNIRTSNLITNDLTNDEMEFFQFEPEFRDCLDFFTIPYDGTGDGVRGIISFNPPVGLSEHIIDKGEGVGKVVNTSGGVLLRKNELSDDSRRV